MKANVIGLGVTLMLWATSAWAQETEGAGEAPAPAPSAEQEAPAPAAAPAPENVAVGKGVEARLSDIQSLENKSIYVVQKRAFSKGKKFELTPVFFSSVNNKFVGHFGLGVSAAYHFRENFGIEFMTTLPFLMKSFFSALVNDVFNYEDLTPEAVDLKRMSYFNALSLQFSAFYGKFEFYGNHVDYDFYATAGVGIARTIELCEAGQGSCSSEEVALGRGEQSPEDGADKMKITGNLGGGARFYFNEGFGLKVEVRDVAFADRAVEAGTGVTTDIRNNIMFMLGASFLL